MTAAWSTRWVGDAKRSNLWVDGIDIADNTIPSHHLSNLRLTYDLGESFGSNPAVTSTGRSGEDGLSPGELRRNIDERLVNENRKRIEVAGVCLKAEALSFE